MPYIVKLWDKTEIVLSNEQAEPIKRAKLEGVKSVSINGNIYDTSAIAQITKGGTLPIDESRQVEAGDTDRRASTEGEGYQRYLKMRAKILGGR